MDDSDESIIILFSRRIPSNYIKIIFIKIFLAVFFVTADCGKYEKLISDFKGCFKLLDAISFI